MEQKFILWGETPAKKNSRIFNTKTKRLFTSKNYSQWHSGALAQLIRQIQFTNISSPVEIKLIFVHGDNRRRDSDNGTASIMDLLVDAGVLTDDNWKIVKRIIVENDYEKDSARCEITIRQID